MRRIVFLILRIIYVAPVYVFHICRLAKKKNPDRQEAFSYIKKVTRRVTRAANVEIEVSGLENIPKEDGFIYYPNHQGMFDALVFLETSPRLFSYVTKKEARNIFLLKQVGDILGAISIDRENIRQSMQVISEMTQRVNKGENFLLFAEGTRSRNGNELLDFKGGSFKAATRAKCPIVPCALIDSYKPFDEKSLKKVRVKQIYLPPLYYEEYKDMKTQDIAVEVKRRIETAIAASLSEAENADKNH